MAFFKFPSTMSVIVSLLFMLLTVSSALEISVSPPRRTDEEVRAMFRWWLIKHGKNYNVRGEKEMRYQIFKDNLRFVDEHNSLERPYRVGLNVFSDLTLEEYHSTFLSKRLEDSLDHTNVSNTSTFHGNVALPDTVDWRTTGAVGPIGDQKHCGASWAFSAAGAIEGIQHITTGKFVLLAPQQLVDCDKTNQGCSAGSRPKAFAWIKKNGGLASEADYPYQAKEGNCKTNAGVISIRDYGFVTESDENALKEAVARQPIAVGLDAGGNAFRHYESGVFTGPCGTDYHHAALVIGYGTENGIPYWLVKNSWSSGWGEKGYAKVQRNVGGLGRCGIATDPCYPTIDRKNSALPVDLDGAVASA